MNRYLLLISFLILVLSIPVMADNNALILPNDLQLIEEDAFYGDKSISKVVLPEGVQEIHSGAFVNSSLTEINLPDTITFIDDNAFDAPGEIVVTAEEGSYAYNWAVKNGYMETSPSEFVYTLSDGRCCIKKYRGKSEYVCVPDYIDGVAVEAIGFEAFYNCSSLKWINLPHTLISIGEKAFYGCDAITVITIPSSATKIYDYAFYGCDKLESIVLNEGLTSIGMYAFAHCPSLKQIRIPDSVTSLGDYFIDEDTGLISATFGGGKKVVAWSTNSLPELKTLTFREGIEDISAVNAYSCSYPKLKNINLPQTLTRIRDSAFYNCDAITDITIPSSVTSIGHRAFYGCDNLESIVLNEGLTSIEDSAFARCPSLKQISIPDSVTSLGSFIIEGDFGLTSVTFGGGIKKITSAMSKIYNSTESIPALHTVTFREGVEEIGRDIYYNYYPNLKTINLPHTLMTIGYRAFNQCTALTEIAIPSNVTSIGWNAFYGCENLESIVLNEGLTSIGNYAFAACPSLKQISIPDSVTSLGYDFIRGDIGLISVTFGGGVKTITSRMTTIRNSTDNIPALQTVTFREGVEEIGGDIYRKYYSNLKNVSLPQTLTKIADEAFRNCDAMTEITIPSSVTSIGNNAFDKNIYIYGVPGSAAEEYANNNECHFIAIPRETS